MPVYETIVLQKDRAIVWGALCLAAGAAGYFALRVEPSLLISMVMAGAGLLGWILSHRLLEKNTDNLWRLLLWVVLGALFLMATGFTVARARTLMLDTVMLQKKMRVADVTGRIAAADLLEEGRGMRIVLDHVRIERLEPEKTPEKIRLNVRRGYDMPPVGGTVHVRVGLNPPPAPSAPGSFDFQRYAYFQGIGAFGFAYGEVKAVGTQAPRNMAGLLEEVRKGIADCVLKFSGYSETASFMIAMLTGERTSLSDDTNRALRNSGLFHILSISGLHIALVAGCIFYFIRLCLALVPGWALERPIKKYAAVLAFAGTFAYCLLVGLSVPTVRSLMMTGIVLLAVVLDRTAISLRLWALAMFAVLLIWPESVWSASFQMSFAAVGALIVFFEWLEPRWRIWRGDAGVFGRLLLNAGASGFTTIVATLATAPFALYHFQQLSLYGVLANFLAIPAMTFVVMPAALASYVLMPLGIEKMALWPMEKGTAFILYVAEQVAAIPGAGPPVQAIPAGAFGLMIAAGCIVLFWRGWGKLAFLVPLLGALLIIFSCRPPDILVTGSGTLMAVRDVDGRLYVSDRMHEKFAAESWMKRNGEEGQALRKWIEGLPGMQCDDEGCRYERDGKHIAFAFHQSAQAEDCAWADILVSTEPVRGSCRAGVVVDRFDLWRNGAHAIWLDGRVESDIGERGRRPWVIGRDRGSPKNN